MPNWALIVCGIFGGIAITLIGLRYLIPFFFKRFALGLFEAKASALKNAKVEFVSISAAEGPLKNPYDEDFDPDEYLEEPRAAGRWVTVQAEVTPQKDQQAEFQFWEPEELSVCRPPAGGKLGAETLEEEGLECYAYRTGCKVPENDEDDDDCGKIQGPGKIDISVYVPQGESQLQLHYYTLLVGQPFTVPD